MKDNRVFYLTKSEDQVMNILWNAKADRSGSGLQ